MANFFKRIVTSSGETTVTFWALRLVSGNVDAGKEEEEEVGALISLVVA